MDPTYQNCSFLRGGEDHLVKLRKFNVSSILRSNNILKSREHSITSLNNMIDHW
jgi:hypothetical protein